MLGVEGQGVGDELDMMLFVNADNKDDTGSIKYGDTVALKSPAGKERYDIVYLYLFDNDEFALVG